MVIYEVNLRIDPSVYDAYLNWLIKHINGPDGMLAMPGFERAYLLVPDPAHLPEAERTKDSTRQLSVQYRVRSARDLNHYLAHHAGRMREDGIRHFGNRFSATRRILNVYDEFPLRAEGSDPGGKTD